MVLEGGVVFGSRGRGGLSEELEVPRTVEVKF